jgi:hypothetical protein
MSELERLADEAATKAAVAVGRDAAKRAVSQLLQGETPAAPDSEGTTPKARRWKLLAFVLLGLCLFVGVVGMVLNYWVWFLGAGVLGFGALYGWWRLRKRLALRSPAATPAAESASAAQRLRVSPEAAAPEPTQPTAAERRAELVSRARALAEARAADEQQVEEELAALKSRMKK